MEAYLLSVGIMAGIYLLMTLGLNLHYGFTGLINFGHVGFFALGAYASALLTTNGTPFFIAFLAAMLAAAAAALPLGLCTLRLRHDYLAIVTLAFAEIVRIVISAEDWLTGGSHGLPGIPRPFAGLGVGGVGDLAFLSLVIAANLIALLLIYLIVHSPFGRLIRAIRDDETAVQALGKRPSGAKTRVFMLGAALGGLGGAFYVHYLSIASPEQFVPIVTFYVWAAMIMGGVGSLLGPVLGASLLFLFLEGSRAVRDVFPGILEVEMSSLRLIVVGLALILLMLYRPNGLVAFRARS
jgi:branched-chain amino acid transport system permease protein